MILLSNGCLTKPFSRHQCKPKNLHVLLISTAIYLCPAQHETQASCQLYAMVSSLQSAMQLIATTTQIELFTRPQNWTCTHLSVSLSVCCLCVCPLRRCCLCICPLICYLPVLSALFAIVHLSVCLSECVNAISLSCHDYQKINYVIFHYQKI